MEGKRERKAWERVEYLGIAKHNFPGGGRYQIPLERGDQVRIVESSNGWYKGIQLSSGAKGIFPAAFIQLMPDTSPSPSLSSNSTPYTPTKQTTTSPKQFFSSGSSRRGLYDKEEASRNELVSKLERIISDWKEHCERTNGGEISIVEESAELLGEICQVVRKDHVPATVATFLKEFVVDLVNVVAVSGMKSGEFVVNNLEYLEYLENEASGMVDSLAAFERARLFLLGTEKFANRVQTIVTLLASLYESPASFNFFQEKLFRLECQRHRVLSHAVSTPSDADLTKKLLLEGVTYDLHVQFQSITPGILPQGSTYALFFTLLSPEDKSPLFEEFVVNIKPDGTVLEESSREALFQMIHSSQVHHDLYLVCTLTRVGPMILGSAASSTNQLETNQTRLHYKRPLGVALWAFGKQINTILTRPVLSGSHALHILQGSKDETPWKRIQSMISSCHDEERKERKPNGSVEEGRPSSPAARMFVTLELKPHEEVVANSLDDGFMATVGKLRASDLVAPHAAHNDLFITLTRGSFLQDKKRAPKNVLVQAILFVREISSGTAHPFAGIRRGVGSRFSSSYSSTVYYHENSPSWNETLLANLPVGTPLENCFILFLFSHASTTPKKSHPFSFSVLALGDLRQVALRDGIHTLNCYQAPSTGDITIQVSAHPSDFLALAWSANGKSTFVKRAGEFFIVESHLCSTTETNRADLSGLFRWMHLESSDQLVLALDKISAHLPPPAISTYLWRIMDTITVILDKTEEDHVIQAAFRALVTIMAKAKESDSSCFAPAQSFNGAFREYTTNEFASQAHSGRLYPVLLGNIRLCLEAYSLEFSTTEETAKPPTPRQQALSSTLGRVLSVLPQLLGMIMVSRHQEEATHRETHLPMEQFKQHLMDLFYLIADLLSQPCKGKQLLEILQCSGIRALAEYLSFGLPSAHIARQPVFLPVELGEIARGILESIHSDSLLVRAEKMKLLTHLCRPFILEDPHSRALVMAAIVRTLQEHLIDLDIESGDACGTVLLQLLSCLEQLHSIQRDEKQRRVDVWNISLLLPDLFRSISTFLRRSPATFLQDAPVPLRLFTCAVSIVADMDHKMQQHLFAVAFRNGTEQDVHSDENELTIKGKFMLQSLEACSSFLSKRMAAGALQQLWEPLWRASLGTIVTLLEWFESRLFFHAEEAQKDKKLDADETEESNTASKFAFFQVGFKLLSVLESTGENEPSKEHVSMVEQVCDLLERCWESSGTTNMAVRLSHDVLSAIVLAQDEFAVAFAKKIFFAFLTKAVTCDTSMEDMERETIRFVETFAQDPSEESKKKVRNLFGIHLKGFSAPQEYRERINLFLGQMLHLSELLVRLKSLPASATHETDRVDALLQVVEYLRRAFPPDRYLKYIEELSTLHEGFGNFVEAAHALILKSQVMETDILQPDSESKETILHRALALLEKGEHWWKAVKVSQMFRELHESKLYHFGTMAQVLEKEAGYYRRLASSAATFYPNYFLVRVHPAERRPSLASLQGFPSPRYSVSTRANLTMDSSFKVFVYKSNLGESRVDFIARLETQFPQAEIVNSHSKSHMNGSAGRTQIEVTTLSPCTWMDLDVIKSLDPGGGLPVFAKLKPVSVLRHEENDQVQSFVYTRTFKMEPAQNREKNEFLDSWVNRRILTTERPLPGLCRRSLVLKEESFEIDPLRIAVQSLHRKNCELLDGIRIFELAPARSADQSFTMLISGVVDAAVNGGVLKNYKTFLNGGYVIDYPEIVAFHGSPEKSHRWVEQLQFLLKQHVKLVQRCLEIHGRVCAADVLPLHEYLTTKFGEFKRLVSELVD